LELSKILALLGKKITPDAAVAALKFQSPLDYPFVDDRLLGVRTARKIRCMDTTDQFKVPQRNIKFVYDDPYVRRIKRGQV
jgi:hypothetical protein